MLGWEFPPFISGGLGTACYGLTKAIDQLGIEIIFLLPKMVESKYTTHVRLLSPSSQRLGTSKSTELKNVRFRTINSMLQPYSTPATYQKQMEETLRLKQKNLSATVDFIGEMDYSSDMYTEVHRYADVAAEL